MAFTAVAGAAPLQAETITVERPKFTIHASEKTLATIRTILPDVANLIGKTKHLVIISPEDVFTHDERQRFLDTPDDPGKYSNKEKANRFFNAVKTSGNLPKAYLKVLKSQQRYLSESFDNLARNAPHAMAADHPEGKICIITGGDPDMPPRKLLAAASNLPDDLITLPDAGSARTYYDLAIRHEHKHCPQDYSKLTTRYGIDYGVALRYEFSADDGAYESYARSYQMGGTFALEVDLFRHARAVSTIRMNTESPYKTEPVHHTNSLKSPDGSPVGEKTILRAVERLRALSDTAAGLVLAQPEILSSEDALVADYFKQAHSWRAFSQAEKLDYATKIPQSLGAGMMSYYPEMEYALYRKLNGILLSAFGPKPQGVIERTMLQITKAYLAGMNALSPRIGITPQAIDFSKRLAAMPADFWDRVFIRAGEKPLPRLEQVLQGFLSRKPSGQPLPLPRPPTP